VLHSKKVLQRYNELLGTANTSQRPERKFAPESKRPDVRLAANRNLAALTRNSWADGKRAFKAIK